MSDFIYSIQQYRAYLFVFLAYDSQNERKERKKKRAQKVRKKKRAQRARKNTKYSYLTAYEVGCYHMHGHVAAVCIWSADGSPREGPRDTAQDPLIPHGTS